MPQIAGNDLSFHGCLVYLDHKEALMSLTDRGIHISFVTGNNIEFAVAFCHFHTAIVKGRADLTAKKLRITGNCCCTVPVPVCIVADNADDLSGIVFFVVYTLLMVQKRKKRLKYQFDVEKSSIFWLTALVNKK